MANTLSVAEAATRLGVSVGTVRRHFDAGHLPGFRLGERGHRRIPIDGLVEVETRRAPINRLHAEEVKPKPASMSTLAPLGPRNPFEGRRR